MTDQEPLVAGMTVEEIRQQYPVEDFPLVHVLVAEVERLSEANLYWCETYVRDIQTMTNQERDLRIAELQKEVKQLQGRVEFLKAEFQAECELLTVRDGTIQRLMAELEEARKGRTRA